MDVETVVAVPVVSAIVGVLVWYVQSRIEAVRAERRRLQDERRKIYIAILEPYIRVLAGIKKPTETSKAMKRMLSFEYRKVSYELNLMGSDEVIRANNAFMQLAYSAGEKPITAEAWIKCWGGLLLAIRKDLGARKTELSTVEMLESQLTDAGAYLPGRR
jgi:hypothetical protein